MPYTATWKLFKWYPMLTLPLFIYMGFMISESGIASDLYKMFHVFFGGIKGGLAIGTMFMMVGISAMNGLSVATLNPFIAEIPTIINIVPMAKPPFIPPKNT